MTNNWKDIHSDFSEELVQKWQIKGFDYEQAKEWINVYLINGRLKPKHFEIANYLKRKYHNVETFKEYLSKSIGTGEKIEKINYLYPSFNPCAIVVSSPVIRSESDDRSGKFKINLLVFDPKENDPSRIKIFSKSSNLEEASYRVRLIKDELEGDIPILALLREGSGKVFLSRIIKNVRLEKKGKVVKSPDKCIKKHDVVNIEMDGRHGLEHAAVYLSNKEVAHVRGKASGALRDNWEYFLEKHEKARELVLYRPFVPFKSPELIEKHIDIAVDAGYGKGKYNLFQNNCEHFATLCVYSVSFSKQVDKLVFLWKSDELERKKIWKSVEENNKKFASLKERLNSQNETQEQIAQISKLVYYKK